MRPIEQDAYEEGTGTCLAACVASLFEVPLSQCSPIFPPNNDSQALMTWTRNHYPMLRCICRSYATNYRISHYEEDGSAIWTYDKPTVPIPRHEGYWIGVFESPRITHTKGSYKGSPGLHAVVMDYDVVIWDPHPQREMGLGTFMEEHRWVLPDPSKL